jgi:hypothetical protein
MARVWPPAEHLATYQLQENDLHVQLPSIDVQDHLIDLYFTYVHPILPVIHKTHFMTEYNARYIFFEDIPHEEYSRTVFLYPIQQTQVRCFEKHPAGKLT